MAILWPRASSSKADHQQAISCRGAAEQSAGETPDSESRSIDEAPVSFHRPHDGTRAGKSRA